MSMKTIETPTPAIIRERTPPPKLYNVVFLNDDFTPMDFVTGVLKTVFNKTQEQAILIMLQVHRGGRGIAGTYPKDTAETKLDRVQEMARNEQHPLQLNIEPA